MGGPLVRNLIAALAFVSVAVSIPQYAHSRASAVGVSSETGEDCYVCWTCDADDPPPTWPFVRADGAQ